MKPVGRALRRSYEYARSVLDRYNAVNGRTNAAAVTLYGFLALFALAVLAIAVLGFVSANERDVAERLVNWLGVEGAAATTVTDAVTVAQSSRTVATVVGLTGLVVVGSSFALSVASAYDTAWHVPTHGIRSRFVGLLWLIGAFTLLAVGGFVTSLIGDLPSVLAGLALLVSLLVGTGLWIWTSWILPNRRIPVRAMLRPAIVGAVGLELLKVLGGYVVPQLVASSSALYGAIGVVFALIAWLWLFGRLVVVITVLEVMGWEREHGTEEVVIRAPLMGGSRSLR